MVLNALSTLGPVKIGALLGCFGSSVRVLDASRSELESVPGIGPKAAAAIRNWESEFDLSAEIESIKRAGVEVITRTDPLFPKPLLELHAPPSVLYVRGSLTGNDFPGVAVVGVRQPTHYGAATAKKLAYQLAHSGVTVISGLARGIDTFAHQAALAAKGRTIAVIGSGLNKLYPPENAALARLIADSGAVISEFPMDFPADRRTFPMRNRIVSGLSLGVLVVEAGSSSGALITANLATEQGRSVYAVPGRLDSPKSVGTNRLIQQGAKLVAGAQDILDDFGLLFRDPPTLSPPKAPSNLSEVERRIFDALEQDEVGLDELIGRSGLPIAQVSSTLLALEIRKHVKSLPGGRYVRTI